MLLKGIFKNSSAFIQLIIFLAVITGGMIVCVLITQLLIVFRFGLSPEIIAQVLQNIVNYPDLLRNIQFFQVIAVFILPSIICAWLFSDNYKFYLKIDNPINIQVALLTIISVIVAIPFINWTYTLNQQLVFPEWLKGVEEWMMMQEKTNNEVLEKILYADTIWILIFNIIIVCILTGIGEEFIFRGMLQNIFGKIIKNPHVVIWLVAILFSAIHLQFYGFLPRLLLGAFFGYLLLYTKNIWIPALGHFTNNFFSVITFHIFQDSPEMGEEVDALGSGSTWWLSIASLALLIFFFMFIKRKSQDFSS